MSSFFAVFEEGCCAEGLVIFEERPLKVRVLCCARAAAGPETFRFGGIVTVLLDSTTEKCRGIRLSDEGDGVWC